MLPCKSRRCATSSNESRTLGYIGESLLAARRYAEGLEYVDCGLRVASEIGELWFISRLHQLRGELLLHAYGTADETVEQSFKKALAVARQQGGKLWELRAAVSLARLRHDQGCHAEARDLLAPIYGWFTEGFDTPDLREAAAVLLAVG
jgi:predicted ATPase